MKNTHPTREPRLWAMSALAAALALSLSACEPVKTAETPGEKLDNAIERTEQAAENAKESAAETAAEARADASAAGSQAVEAVKEAGTEAREAVASAGTAIGQAVDDATVTATVSAQLARDPELSAIRIDVDTQGGAVTLSGPAPSAEARARAEDIAKAVNGVSSVTNKLEVKPM